jgi:hypothetical protein
VSRMTGVENGTVFSCGWNEDNHLLMGGVNITNAPTPSFQTNGINFAMVATSATSTFASASNPPPPVFNNLQLTAPCLSQAPTRALSWG